MRRGKPKARCTDCGFEWYGSTAAHALKTVGICTRCRGAVVFLDESADPAIDDVPADQPAHLVLGTPRL